MELPRKVSVGRENRVLQLGTTDLAPENALDFE